MRFLIIDDNSVDRLLLVSLLKGLGYSVNDHESSEGLEEQIIRQNYTAIFLDIIMPGQDGYQFLRSLRKQFPDQPQYIIFYSGKSSPVEINYGIKVCGANDYLIKPVTLENLWQVLSKIPGLTLTETTVKDKLASVLTVNLTPQEPVSPAINPQVPQTPQKLTLPTPQPLRPTSEKTLTSKNSPPEDKNPAKDDPLKEKTREYNSPKRIYRGIEY